MLGVLGFGGGEVKEEFEDERMRTIFNGKQGIMLVIKKSSTADIIRVVDKVKLYLDEKQKSIPGEIIFFPGHI